jgi:hypothetical protein
MNQEITVQEIKSPEEQCLRVAYEAATQHWIHAEETRWTLLYNYFMGTNILLIAWATIFASQLPGRKLLLGALALCGSLVSVLWIFLADRASGFVQIYSRLGEELETSLGKKTNADPNFSFPFIKARKYREELAGIPRLITSSLAVVAVPALFAILYLILVSIVVCSRVAHTG